MANPKTLIPLTERSPEEQKRIRSMGGKARYKQKVEERSLSQLVKVWANCKVKDKKQKEVLEAFGIDEPTNKALILMQLIKNLSITRASSRTIEQLIELLQEDKEKEERIKKLELENEKLQKEINGELTTGQVVVINDLGKKDGTTTKIE